jgi:hypothetical protein
MKYIKKFEINNTLEISNDDYVIIDRNYFKDKTERCCKVIKVESINYYLVLLSNGQDIWCTYYMIIRKMTTKEIEKYEMELKSNKYNI